MAPQQQVQYLSTYNRHESAGGKAGKVGGQRIHSWFVVECVGRGWEGRDDSERGKKKRGDGGWESSRSRNMREIMWVD